MALDEIIQYFHDPDTIHAKCVGCPNHGTQYSCPPFPNDIIDGIKEYTHVIFFSFTTNSIDHLPEFESFMLSLEKRLQATSTTTIGKCIHCGEEPCARLSCEPCRHPDLVRPSLEALGFNVVAIAHDILGITLQWKEESKKPTEMNFISALFLN